eukprot:2445961-Prymnesium_polylepis.2
MGRAPGGRAATRGTRGRPDLVVNHGAPAFEARSPQFKRMCEHLLEADALTKISPDKIGTFGTDGTFEPEAPGAPTRYVARSGSMSALCHALLGATPSVSTACVAPAPLEAA